MARTKKQAAVSGDVLLEKFKGFGGIKVLERRLLHPDLPGSLPIRLKDEPAYTDDPHGLRRIWYVRWINGALEGRTSEVREGLGYEPVRIEELQHADMLYGTHKSDDGVVRRGDKGQEWLAKMPLELYNEIKRRQRVQREKRSRNAKMVKEDLANAAGSALGSEAGDAIHDDFSVSVRRERSTYGEELNDEA